MTAIAPIIEAVISTAAQRIVQAEMARCAAEVEIEVVRHEAEWALAKQWEAIVRRILEHRFVSAPISLIWLLQTVTPAQRNPVMDLLLNTPSAEACLQVVRQFLSTQDGVLAK